MSKVCGKCVYYRACEANGFEACYGDSDYAQGCKSYRAQREHQPDPCADVDKKKTGKKERGNKKVGAKKGKKPKRKKPEQKGGKKQKKAEPRPEPVKQAAPKKKKNRHKKAHTPNLDAQKPQIKDSTEQESLMKPFYLSF